MAIQKTEKRFNKFIYRSMALALMLVFVTSTGWALITNQSAVLSTDLAGNGIAAIGDTITFSCRSSVSDPANPPFVDLSEFGNAYFPLVNIAGNYYSAFFTVSPGNIEDNVVKQFQFIDEGGVAIGGNLVIDNRRPNSTYGPSVQGGSGPGGLFRVGDNLIIDIVMSTPLDSDIPRANLTAIGLGSGHMFARTGGSNSAPEYRLSIPFPMNREGNATGITVTATDNAGNSRSWDTSVSYDTVAPEIQSVIAVNLTDNKVWVTEGDTVRIQATISNYDFDTVTVYHPVLFPGGRLMVRQSGSTPGSPAVYEYDYYVTGSPPLTSNFVSFEVRAVDNVGNESTPRTSNPLMLDNIPPEFAYPFGVNLIENGGIIGDNIAIIGDQLHFFGNLSSLMNNVTVTVDLSAIGGFNNQIIPFNNSATTTFELLYTIHQFTSEDSMPRAFVVSARDTAGNEISQVALPVLYVDNDPPVISAGQVQNVSRPGQPVRHGDTIAISANVNKLDGGSVWVNFERLGGTASSTLSPYSGATYRLEHVVGDPTSGAPVDQNMSFTIFAVDNAGNLVQTVTAPISIDNDPPEILESSYTNSTWPLSASHPYVRVDDRITFRVKIAGPVGQINDGTRVFMNLPEFGYASPVEMTFNGMDAYTLSVDVPAGDINDTHYFSFYAEDNAGNRRSSAIQVKIDQKPPDVGPMAVNFMTDLNVTGIVNIGDRLEFIVPVANPDGGTATIDLSYVGGPSAYVMNYDAVLSRYYLVHDVTEAPMESPSYVFRATVRDKAGNTMNSLSGTFDVDARPPIIDSVNITHTNLGGLPNVVNIGDKVTIVAEVPLSAIDGGIPTVDLTKLGGSSNQRLYDDGAHGDGLANDGIFGYIHTVTAGNTDGENVTLVVQVTDNAGNRVVKSAPEDPEPKLFVDNKPLVITSCTVTQIFDNNGNGIVDLDGFYTTYPQVATDQVLIQVRFTGNPNDKGTLTADLTAMGHSAAYEMEITEVAGGWLGSATVALKKGTTNISNGTGSGKNVAFTVTLTDVNGNKVVQNTSNTVDIDNRPPKLEVYPISFVVDGGRLGEANLGDVIQIRVRLNDHDGILPQIDFTNLYLENGMTPPGPTLFPPNTTGGNEYVYQWTVPEGLGTRSSLAILAYDESGNMTHKATEEIRFLSKIPAIAGFPQTRAELSSDVIPQGGNRIANPANYKDTTADKVTITTTLTSAYNIPNDPPAEVVVNVRSIVDPLIAGTPDYDDGDPDTFWRKLDYDTAVSGGGNYVYRKTFSVAAGKYEEEVASFAVMVLHPDVRSIVMAQASAVSNPANPFAIDTRIPDIRSIDFELINDFGDNPDPELMNIGDLLEISADIRDFSDPGSVTAILMDHTDKEIHRLSLSNDFGTTFWRGTFEVQEPRPRGWPAIDGTNSIRYQVIVSDDADNFAQMKKNNAPFKIKNTKPDILAAELLVKNPQRQNIDPSWGPNPEAWIVNVGSGEYPDSIVASLTLVDSASLDRAYVDFTLIGGTSTYALDKQMFGPTNTLYSEPFIASDTSYDLATRTFRIWAVDKAGNKAFVNVEQPVDTKRPELLSATYDGKILELNFSENVKYIDPKLIRIEKQIGQTDSDSGFAVNVASLTLDYADVNAGLAVEPSRKVPLALSSGTKSIVADWGKTDLYLSYTDSNTNALPQTPGALDESGNWLVPLSRSPALFSIDVIENYWTRPMLVGASYNYSTAELELAFDKDMDVLSMTQESLQRLAIWRNLSDAGDNFTNRYRFSSDPAVNDQIDTLKRQGQTIVIKLSTEAQEWVAINYGKDATQFALTIDGSKHDPHPGAGDPLVRDRQGNRVVPVSRTNAVGGSMTARNIKFSIQDYSLNLEGENAILTLEFDEPARLYTDQYSSNKLERGRELRVGFSRVFLYGDENMTMSLPLNENMIANLSIFQGLNPDYASTSVKIPLSQDAWLTMLSWGSGKFYLACSEGAFVDLWGNLTHRLPAQGDRARKIDDVAKPDTDRPYVSTVTLSPATKSGDDLLFRGQTAGNLYYEVALKTDKLSGVNIPIDRTITPELELYVGATMVDRGDFVSWSEHQQGDELRTVAIFNNSRDFASGNYQKENVEFRVSEFRDIFSDANFTDVAAMAYSLADKRTNGFTSDAREAKLDNKAPEVKSITPVDPEVIGITAAESAIFRVTFSEAMDAERARAPQLQLIQGTSTIMSFTFDRWEDSGETAVFKNTVAFNAATPQGTAYYKVSGGYDEVGNRHELTENIEGLKVVIRSRGPSIESYQVRTYQETTGKSYTDAPFSPHVAPGVATISVRLQNDPVGSDHWLHIYESGAFVASAPLKFGGSLTGEATWSASGANFPSGLRRPIKLELRVFDEAGNEGSLRGEMYFDDEAPLVSRWEFGNLRKFNNIAYFSPNVTSVAKIDLFGPTTGQALKMRLVGPQPLESIDTYFLTEMSGGGYTLSFDGRNSGSPAQTLTDGEYLVNVVDLAGNIGKPLSVSSKATGTLVIDRTAPVISAINTFRDGTPTTRFNPNAAPNVLRIDVVTDDPTVASGTAMVKIMAGSTLIRELPLKGSSTPRAGTYSVEWDGKGNDMQPVNDGTYRISVIDLAGNESSNVIKDIDVVTSIFKVTSVNQVTRNKVRMTFSHPVAATSSANNGLYTISPTEPAGIGFASPAEVEGSVVTLTLNQTMKNGTTYTLRVEPGFVSIDGAQIPSGNNSGQFTADTQGPKIFPPINYDGITAQNMFNLVFDEELEPVSAQRKENYTLTSGTATLALDSVVLRSDLRSVTITALDDIVERQSYIIIASGVKDLFDNPSDGNTARLQFEGQDVTPPVLDITVFSNPANEFDIIVAVKSNEALSGAPTATITQGGRAAASLTLKAGPNSLMFIGGTHLDVGGDYVIIVSAEDLAGNVGTANKPFSVLSVNASVRAQITSPDKLFKAVFEPGTLNKNSMIIVVPETLAKVEASSTRASMILPSVFEDLQHSQLASLRASSIGGGNSAQELVPVGTAYSFNVPAGRIEKPVAMRMSLTAEQLEAGVSLYRSDISGYWKPVAAKISDGELSFTADSAGTFAMLKDVVAPRASMMSEITEEPIREARPSFVWKLEEYGSGVDYESVRVMLNNKAELVAVDAKADAAWFVPTEDLPGGEYELVFSVADMAGNKRVAEAIRFQVIPPLKIHEVVQFPNPARNRANIRVSTNRNDLSWDHIDVKIYDTAGHRVADNNNLVIRFGTSKSRQNHDVIWDLRASGGKPVANGVYFARITVRDPDDWNKTARYTHKIAVLR